MVSRAPSAKGWLLIYPNLTSTAISSEMICEVLVFMGMDQQYVIPDNTPPPPNKGDCLISNPNEEYGYFPKNNDIYFNFIPVVSNGFNCTNIL